MHCCYNSCFFKKYCNYTNNCDIQLHDANLEHSRIKKKRTSCSYVFLAIFAFWHPRISFRSLKDGIRICFFVMYYDQQSISLFLAWYGSQTVCTVNVHYYSNSLLFANIRYKQESFMLNFMLKSIMDKTVFVYCWLSFSL